MCSFVFFFIQFTHPVFIFQYMTLDLEQIKDAHEVWFHANSRVNERKQSERNEALKEQESKASKEKADFTDINVLLGEKGQGPHLLELEFEPVMDEPEEYISSRTGKTTQCWSWRHKLTGAVLKRFTSATGKSWDTGKLSSYLRKLVGNENKIASQRAEYILKLNSKHIRRKAGVCVSVRVPTGDEKQNLVKQWVSEVFWNCLFF